MRVASWVGQALVLAVVLAAGSFQATAATTLPVPNASFESPRTLFVDTRIDAWQRPPTPAWYDERGGFLWSQLTGLFQNTGPGTFDHITNIDGNQGVWMFAIPEVALFQELSADPANAESGARFHPGKSYSLTTAIIGAGGGMSNGVTLEISLYYLDDLGRRQLVSALTVTNDTSLHGDRTRFRDIELVTPPVRADDPWAERPIGIRYLSTVSAALQGGYWDLDNVRLRELDPPSLAGVVRPDGTFELTVRSEPGQVFDILTSTDPTLPAAGWNHAGTVTNQSGTAFFIDRERPVSQPGRFYRARTAR